MQSKEKDDMIFIRLFPGEEIIKNILLCCKKHNLETGIIISGIGQLKNVKIGYFKKKGDYSPEIIKKPTELILLSGNICKKEYEYILHAHITLGDEKKKLIGGHLIEGTVNITAEIVILKSNINISRVYDDETGLENLELK
jgi:predicted DNA-binding protein with PD1-like motif